MGSMNSFGLFFFIFFFFKTCWDCLKLNMVHHFTGSGSQKQGNTKIEVMAKLWFSQREKCAQEKTAKSWWGWREGGQGGGRQDEGAAHIIDQCGGCCSAWVWHHFQVVWIVLCTAQPLKESFGNISVLCSYHTILVVSMPDHNRRLPV